MVTQGTLLSFSFIFQLFFNNQNDYHKFVFALALLIKHGSLTSVVLA